MSQLARKNERTSAVEQEPGTVLRRDGDVFIVETDSADVRARRATSCLLDPAVGDLVLVAVLPRGHAYVLAVLEREEGAPGTLVSDGSLRVDVRRGTLGLAASEGVHVVAGKDVSLVAPALHGRAADAHVGLDRLSYVGAFVRAQLDRAKLLGKSLDTVFERISSRAKRSHRVVEEADHLRAERIDYAASSAIHLKGQTAVITAEQLVKVDGDQIHLG